MKDKYGSINTVRYSIKEAGALVPFIISRLFKKTSFLGRFFNHPLPRSS